MSFRHSPRPANIAALCLIVSLALLAAPHEAWALVGLTPSAESAVYNNGGSPNFTSGATGCTSTSVSFNTNSFVTCTSGAWVVEPVITPLIYPTSDSTTAIQFDKANGSTNVMDIDTTNGRVGIGSTSPIVSLDLSQKADAIALPSGASGVRPTGGNLANGEIRYNSTIQSVEAYYNGTWNSLESSVTAGTSTPAAGSSGQVQFNTGGTLNANANFTWDNTNDALTLATIANPAASALTITGGALTGTTSYPALNVTQAWNNAGGTFTGILENVTNTASNTSSMLMNLQVGGTSEFSITERGYVTAAGTGTFNNLLISSALGSISFAGDTSLTRFSAANLHLGVADSATPIAQTLGVQNVVAGTSNTAGANFTITGSQGTGTGAGGSILFQTAPAGLTGSTQNALATAMTIAGTGYVGIGTTSPLQTLDVESAASANAFIRVGINGGSTKGGLYLGNGGNTYGELSFANTNNNVSLLQEYTSGNLIFGTNSAEKMRIDINGNVGIGTTTPTSLLNTVDTAAKTTAYTGVLHTVTNTSGTNSINKIGMDIESTGTWNGTSAINTGLVVNATGGTTNYAATFNGGNVGIGTTSPNALLDVNSTSIIIEQSHTPADNATCTAGTHWWDANFIYVCTASGTVKRAALSAF
jgi:hypothetical protein